MCVRTIDVYGIIIKTSRLFLSAGYKKHELIIKDEQNITLSIIKKNVLLKLFPRKMPRTELLLYILTSKWVLHTLFPGLNNLFQIVNIFFFQDIGKRWLEDANMSKTN